MSLEVTHHYSGEVQESPPFTTHLLSLFSVYLSLLFRNGNCWTLKQCLKLSGSSLQFQTSSVIWPRVWYFFTKVPQDLICLQNTPYLRNSCFAPTDNASPCSWIEQKQHRSLKIQGSWALFSYDNGLMEIEAQYFGKAETGILRAYVLGKQKCLRSWLKGIENKAFYISLN